MITVARREMRLHDRKPSYDVWTTPIPSMGAANGLEEIALQPGGILPRRDGGSAEVLLFVREGAVAYEVSNGRAGIVQAGELQHRIEDTRVRYRGSNASRTESARAFVLSLAVDGARPPGPHRQRRFGNAELRNALCLVASPKASEVSLRMLSDVEVYCALLADGHHVAMDLATNRRAFVHVMRGTLQVGDFTLVAGDSASFTEERAVSATARHAAEILLVDVGEGPPAAASGGKSPARR